MEIVREGLALTHLDNQSTGSRRVVARSQRNRGLWASLRSPSLGVKACQLFSSWSIPLEDLLSARNSKTLSCLMFIFFIYYLDFILMHVITV